KVNHDEGLTRAASVLGRIEGALDIAYRRRDQHRARGAGGGGGGGGGGGSGGGGHRIGQGIERQQDLGGHAAEADIAHGFDEHRVEVHGVDEPEEALVRIEAVRNIRFRGRSEEHTSELQSRGHLVCRLLLE